MSRLRPEPTGVSPLLDDVAKAAGRYRQAKEERGRALEELRTVVRAARDEGISFAAIARSAGISLEYARRLYAGR